MQSYCVRPVCFFEGVIGMQRFFNMTGFRCAQLRDGSLHYCWRCFYATGAWGLSSMKWLPCKNSDGLVSQLHGLWLHLHSSWPSAPVRPPCFLLLRLSVASSSVKAWGHKQVSSSSLSVASSSRSTAQDITQRDSISIYFARVYISFFERFSTSGRLPLTSLRIRDQEEQDPFPM